MSAYIKSIADVPQVDLNNLPRFKTNIPELDKCIGGLLFGTVTILTGKRGNGKSTFMSQLICEAIDQGVKTFVYSGELADFHFKGWIDLQLAGKENLDSVQDEFGNTLYSIPDTVEAKINEWYRERLYLYDKRYVPKDGEYETLDSIKCQRAESRSVQIRGYVGRYCEDQRCGDSAGVASEEGRQR